jgi:hypothetical protein
VAWGLVAAAPVFFLGLLLLLRREGARWLAVAAFAVRGLALPAVYVLMVLFGTAPRPGPPADGLGVVAGAAFHLLLALALALVPLCVLRGGRS